MNRPDQATFILRPIVALSFLVIATLLLTVTQFTGAAADTGPDETGALWLSVVEGNAPLASASLLIGPEVRLNSPEGVFTGPEGVNEFSSTLRRSFSNLNFATTSTETVDNLVIVTFTMTGINTGSYHDRPAKCAGVAVDGVAVLILDGTGVREQWIGYDLPTLHAQIDAFNQAEPDSRPSCNFVPETVPAPMPEPSTCMLLNSCSYQP